MIEKLGVVVCDNNYCRSIQYKLTWDADYQNKATIEKLLRSLMVNPESDPEN